MRVEVRAVAPVIRRIDARRRRQAPRRRRACVRAEPRLADALHRNRRADAGNLKLADVLLYDTDRAAIEREIEQCLVVIPGAPEFRAGKDARARRNLVRRDDGRWPARLGEAAGFRARPVGAELRNDTRIATGPEIAELGQRAPKVGVIRSGIDRPADIVAI